MKNFLRITTFMLVLLSIQLFGQELLKGGNMEDSIAWKVVHLDSYDKSEYEFNYLAGGPAEGKGGCLNVTCSGNQWTNILFYQEVLLTGGNQYQVSGAFKDLAGTINNFWCEILYDTLEPPQDNRDFGGIIIVGFNTWNGTKAGVDGTFQDDYVKGPGPIFTAPGETGKPIKIYFCINVGAWTGGSTYSFDVAIDEVSLKPLESTDVKDFTNDFPVNFYLYQNYPNPFNPLTNISFQVSSTSYVILKIYDELGKEVTTLVDKMLQPGKYEINFDASKLSTGVYFCRMQADNFIDVKKMILIK